MRGQGPGSEHERREAGGAPPTPPPSFGRRPPSEQGGPSAFPDDPAAQAWLTVDGEPPREDAWQPAGAAPADTWLSVQEPSRDDSPDVRDGAAIASATAAQHLPGAQPWEVQDAEGAAYDWYAEDEEPAGMTAAPPPESSWGEPGTPRWEPPPAFTAAAFTAAAAGMQVWPAPVTDSPAMPPWPAATGELEPDDDTPALHDGEHITAPTGPATPSPAAHPVPQPPSDGRHDPPQAWEAGSVPPDSSEGWGAEPERAAPPHYFGPGAMPPHPVPLGAPTPADLDSPPPAPGGNSPYGMNAEELYPAEDPRPPYGVEPTRPSYDQDIEGPTRPGRVPPFARKGAPGFGTGGPVPSPGPKGPPAPLFDPERSPAAQQGTRTPPPAPPDTGAGQSVPPSDAATPPVIGAHPHGTGAPEDGGEPRPNHAGRRTEPGDVPVWPPSPQRDEPDRDQLDLPFAPEVWGHRSTPGSPDERQESAEPPAEEPSTGIPQPSGHPPGSVIQGVPIRPPGSIPHGSAQSGTGRSTAPPHGPAAKPQTKPGSPDGTGAPAEGKPAVPHTPAALPHGGLVAPLPGRLPAQGEPVQGELASLREGDQPGFRQPPFAPIEVQEPPKSKRALFATLGVLVLAGVATGGFFAVRSASTSAPSGVTASVRTTPPATEPTASVTTPAQPAGTSVLNSEITDPKTLSLKEAFPEKKVDAAGATFTRVKTDVAADCSDAASGPFAEALKQQKCSRVLRATYVDRKRRYAVTTGIAVLPSKDAAVEVDQAKDLGRNLWFRGLAGPDGSGGDRVHIAGGYAAGLVWGRYIVFSYATHADGHTPDGKEKALVKVSSEFRDETAKVLERRITNN